MSDSVDQYDLELIDYAKAVAKDGTCTQEFCLDPEKPAKALGIILSPEAKKRLQDYKVQDLIKKGGSGQTEAIPQLAIVAIIVLTKTDPNELVIDRSGKFKL